MLRNKFLNCNSILLLLLLLLAQRYIQCETICKVVQLNIHCWLPIPTDRFCLSCVGCLLRRRCGRVDKWALLLNWFLAVGISPQSFCGFVAVELANVEASKHLLEKLATGWLLLVNIDNQGANELKNVWICASLETIHPKKPFRWELHQCLLDSVLRRFQKMENPNERLTVAWSECEWRFNVDLRCNRRRCGAIDWEIFSSQVLLNVNVGLWCNRRRCGANDWHVFSSQVLLNVNVGVLERQLISDVLCHVTRERCWVKEGTSAELLSAFAPDEDRWGWQRNVAGWFVARREVIECHHGSIQYAAAVCCLVVLHFLHVGWEMKKCVVRFLQSRRDFWLRLMFDMYSTGWMRTMSLWPVLKDVRVDAESLR